MNKEKIKNLLINKNRSKTNQKVQITTLLSIAILLPINLIRIHDFIVNPLNQGLPLNITLALLLILIIPYVLARTNRTKAGAWLLITIYALPTLFCFYSWGADLPAALLMSILIAMMASIFLGAKEAFGVSLIFSLNIIILSFLQENSLITISDNWRQEPHQLIDAIAYVLINSIVFFLVWITGKESHHALKVAKQSQLALKAEKEKLEIKVAERTKEIINIKRERMEQLQALASIGQLSGGIFHDIINPLTVVNLNLEQMKNESCPSLPASQDYIQQALKASNRIQELIQSANNCLRQRNQDQTFFVYQEISQIKKIMEAKARMNNIKLELSGCQYLKIRGGRARFGQIVMNLIANAIDASTNLNRQSIIKLKVEHKHQENKIQISVSDQGVGISPENIEKIFQTFFSTKIKSGRNTGLGLSIVKDIVEQDFNGEIKVESQLNKGTTFIINLPYNHGNH